MQGSEHSLAFTTYFRKANVRVPFEALDPNREIQQRHSQVQGVMNSAQGCGSHEKGVP